MLAVDEREAPAPNSVPARQRHRGRSGTKTATLDLLRTLLSDERFRPLGPRAQMVLLVGVLLHADADGRWQIKRSTWAEECGWQPRGKGSPPGWIGQAIREAKACGLLRVQPYIRPPGARTPGQGASIYSLDPALVARAADPGPPCRGTDSGPATRQADSDPAVRRAASGSPERVLNELLNGEHSGFERPTVAPLGPRIADECMRCRRLREVRDDGRMVLCDDCRVWGNAR
jgi:hypothetical protein